MKGPVGLCHLIEISHAMWPLQIFYLFIYLIISSKFKTLKKLKLIQFIPDCNCGTFPQS